MNEQGLVELLGEAEQAEDEFDGVFEALDSEEEQAEDWADGAPEEVVFDYQGAKTSQAVLRAMKKYYRKNRAILSCSLSKKTAERFRAAAEMNGETVNSVLNRFVLYYTRKAPKLKREAEERAERKRLMEEKAAEKAAKREAEEKAREAWEAAKRERDRLFYERAGVYLPDEDDFTVGGADDGED